MQILCTYTCVHTVCTSFATFFFIILYAYTHGEKRKNQGDNESGGTLKESPGKEIEVVWAYDEKMEAECREERDGEMGMEEQGRRKN